MRKGNSLGWNFHPILLEAAEIAALTSVGLLGVPVFYDRLFSCCFYFTNLWWCDVWVAFLPG